MRNEFGGARSRDPNFTDRKLQESTNLNAYMSVSTDIDEKRFVAFEHIINHLCFGYVCLPYLNTFCSFFLNFFFFSYLFLNS